jgi:prenyltransferase beta subunit
MAAVEQLKDIEQIREEAANVLFDAAVQFIMAVDQSAGYCGRAQKDADIAYSLYQKHITLEFLHRLFPDRAADIARLTS